MNKYGLIGHHLSHSYSQIIHQYLFDKNNIAATYSIIDIEKEKIENYINQLKNNIYQGFNVTIPYKEEVIQYCDILTDSAKNIGAVNTIYLRDGKVVGDNTDYLGFISELKIYDIDVKGKDVYVLGNGGASKAICYALESLKANPIIVSRSGEGLTYDEFKQIDHYDVLINTTPVGMYPNIGECIIEECHVKKASVCVDLIYRPQVTRFLSYANEAYNGLYMLIFQAIHAEEYWQKTKLNYDLEELLKLF